MLVIILWNVMSDRIVLNFVFKTNNEEVDVKVQSNEPTSSKKKMALIMRSVQKFNQFKFNQ